MSYYMEGNFFEYWGMQDHSKHWTFGKVPRWIQFNNNGGKLEKPAKRPVELMEARQAYDLVLAKAGCA